MQMLHERQQPMNDLGLFRRCAEEAGGVGYEMRGGKGFEPRFEVGEFFGVVGCLLVLGVEADGYSRDHALGFVLRDGRKDQSVERLTTMDLDFLAVPFPRGRHW